MSAGCPRPYGLRSLKQESCIIWKKVRLYLYYTRLRSSTIWHSIIMASLRQQPVVFVVVVVVVVVVALVQLESTMHACSSVE